MQESKIMSEMKRDVSSMMTGFPAFPALTSCRDDTWIVDDNERHTASVEVSKKCTRLNRNHRFGDIPRRE